MPAFGVREKKWSRNGSALPRLMTINVSLVYGTAWEDLTYVYGYQAASEAACRQDVSAAKHALRFRLRSSCFVFFSPRHFYRKKCVLPPFSFSHFLFPWPLLLVYIGHQAADHYYIPSTVVVFTFPRTHDLRYRSKKSAPVYPLVVTNISSFVRYSFPARDGRNSHARAADNHTKHERELRWQVWNAVIRVLPFEMLALVEFLCKITSLALCLSFLVLSLVVQQSLLIHCGVNSKR